MTRSSDEDAQLHPEAQKLNQRLAESAPEVYEMLSPLGRRLYFPAFAATPP